MSARRMTLPRRGERGFTLVELLITVVIIAILTAIAVPAYITVVANAQDSAAKQVLSSVESAQEIAAAQNAIDGSGGYLAKSGLVSTGALAIGEKADVLAGDGCWVAASESDTGKTFYATSRGPVETNGYAVPDTSWCTPAAGLLNAEITNLATNPRVASPTVTWSSHPGAGGGTTSYGAQATTGPWGGNDYVITWTSTSTGSGGSYFTTPLASPVGKTFTSSLWVQANFDQEISLTIEWKSSTAILRRDYGTPVQLKANTWTRISHTATPPAGTIQATSTAYATTSGTGHAWQAGESLRATAAMFTEGSTLHTFAAAGTPGWTANPDGTSTGFPYTIDSVAGSPLAALTGVGQVDLTTADIGPLESRTAYGVFDRVSLPTTVDNLAILDIQEWNATASGIVKASAGTNGFYGFRPQFRDGGGASAVYTLTELAQSGIGKNIISISMDFESKKGRISTKAGAREPASAFDTGSGWDTPRLIVATAASDIGVGGLLFSGLHSAATEAKVNTWLQQHYGFAG